jgi:hypothetical protein
MHRTLNWLRTHKPWTWIFSGIGVSFFAWLIGAWQSQPEVIKNPPNSGLVSGGNISVAGNGNIAGRDIVSNNHLGRARELPDKSPERDGEGQVPIESEPANGGVIADGNVDFQGSGNIAGRDVIVYRRDSDSIERLQVVSEEYGVTKAALRNFFRTIGQEPVTIDNLDHTLRQVAHEFVVLKERLEELQSQDLGANTQEVSSAFGQILDSIRSAAAISSPDSELVQLLDEWAAFARAQAAEAYRLNDQRLGDSFSRQAEAFENAKEELLGIYVTSFRDLREVQRARRRYELSMKVRQFDLASEQVAEANSILQRVAAQVEATSNTLTTFAAAVQ